ncbi:MAG: MBL fold metallo-hydrolase [Oscillospiraceae bacterium]
MAKLYYQGHGSYRITSDEGKVVYVDPYAGDGYDVPADVILETHGHFDHNVLEKPAKKEGCVIITEKEALAGGDYQKFSLCGIDILAVPAYNKNHDPKECVGYIITVDGVKVYASGDTSKTEYMEKVLPGMKLDYALLPCDGVYNMDAAGAAECARLIGAKVSIPVHTIPGGLFSREVAEKFDIEERLIIEPGETIDL